MYKWLKRLFHKHVIGVVVHSEEEYGVDCCVMAMCIADGCSNNKRYALYKYENPPWRNYVIYLEPSMGGAEENACHSLLLPYTKQWL